MIQKRNVLSAQMLVGTAWYVKKPVTTRLNQFPCSGIEPPQPASPSLTHTEGAWGLLNCKGCIIYSRKLDAARDLATDRVLLLAENVLCRVARQTHRKHRALARLARHGHIATHHARERARDGET
jgi:hypothetical protein